MLYDLFACKITETVWLNPSVKKIRFRSDKEILFEAGQSLLVEIPPLEGDLMPVLKAYTFSSSLVEARAFGYEILVPFDLTDRNSLYLCSLANGETFYSAGTSSSVLWEKTRFPEKMVLIATPSGVGALKAMIGSLEYRRHPAQFIQLIQGVKTEEEILFREYFEKRGVPVTGCITQSKTSLGIHSYPGRVTEFLRSPGLNWDWAKIHFFVLGKQEMIEDVSELLQNVFKVDENRITTNSIQCGRLLTKMVHQNRAGIRYIE